MATATNPYSAFAEGFTSGVPIGLSLAKAYRNKKDRRLSEEMLTINNELSNYDPSAANSTGAIPEAGQPSNDGRTGEGQGYSGNAVKDMIARSRALAAKLGDPEQAAYNDWVMRDTTTRRFEDYMKSSALKLASDPKGAANDAQMASAFLTDGVAPTINAITMNDGTNLLVQSRTDPKTGETTTTPMSTEQLQTMMSYKQPMQDFLAVTGGFEASYADALNKQYEARATSNNNLAAFNKQAVTDMDATFKDVMDLPETMTTITIQEGGLGDSLVGVAPGEPGYVPGAPLETTTVKIPSITGDPVAFRQLKASALALYRYNEPYLSQEQLDSGELPRSNIEVTTARDLSLAMVDGMTQGDSFEGIVGLTPAGEPTETGQEFRYGGVRVYVPKFLMDDWQRIADARRAKAGALPSAPGANFNPDQDSPSGVPANPDASSAIPETPIPAP